MWDLTLEDCKALPETGPLWDAGGVVEPLPLTAEQLQAECDAFVKAMDERADAFYKWVGAEAERIYMLIEASQAAPTLRSAILAGLLAEIHRVGNKYA